MEGKSINNSLNANFVDKWRQPLDKNENLVKTTKELVKQEIRAENLMGTQIARE